MTHSPETCTCTSTTNSRPIRPLTFCHVPERAAFYSVQETCARQESPAVADKPARRLRKVFTVYVRAVGLL